MRAGKRRKSVTSEDKGNLINSSGENENNNNDDRLPIMQSQIRESRRARKRLKGFENYEIRIN